MAEKNIQMKERNSSNTDYDLLYPVTKAANVKTSSGENVETEITSLKQSVSDGKTLLETAITDVGGTVSNPTGIPTFNALDEGIRGINTAVSIIDSPIKQKFLTVTYQGGDSARVFSRRTLQNSIYTMYSVAMNNELYIMDNTGKVIAITRETSNYTNFDPSQSNPFSNTVQLPDGGWLFAWRNMMFKINADFSGISRVVANTSVFSVYNNMILFTTLNGNICVVDTGGRVAVITTSLQLLYNPSNLNPSTYMVDPSTPGAMIEDGDYIYAKSGSSGGPLIKFYRNITSISSTVALATTHFNGWGIVVIGDDIYAGDTNNQIYRYNKNTLSLTQIHSDGSAGVDRTAGNALIHDKLRNVLYSANSSAFSTFNLTTRTFIPYSTEKLFYQPDTSIYQSWSGTILPQAYAFMFGRNIYWYALQSIK